MLEKHYYDNNIEYALLGAAVATPAGKSPSPCR
jgi:hypothetical protein